MYVFPEKTSKEGPLDNCTTLRVRGGGVSPVYLPHGTGNEIQCLSQTLGRFSKYTQGICVTYLHDPLDFPSTGRARLGRLGVSVLEKSVQEGYPVEVPVYSESQFRSPTVEDVVPQRRRRLTRRDGTGVKVFLIFKLSYYSSVIIRFLSLL